VAATADAAAAHRAAAALTSHLADSQAARDVEERAAAVDAAALAARVLRLVRLLACKAPACLLDARMFRCGMRAAARG
jgi:hypothetical protein